MVRIAGTMLPVLEYLGEPVLLKPSSLGEPFLSFKGVSLQSGAVVVTTDEDGRVSSKPLGKFRAEECIAILRGAVPELQRLVADKRRATQVRPVLSVRVALEGSRFIIDLRSYRAEISNSGGECRDLVVSGDFPGGRTKPSRPRKLGRGEKLDIDLGVNKEVSSELGIRLILDCKDVDGRLLFGERTFRPDDERQQEVLLNKKRQK